MKSMMSGSSTGREVSKAELAMMLGVTRHAIDRMVAVGMPYLERGGQKRSRVDWKFDSAAVIRWLCDTDVAEEVARQESGGERLKRLHPDDPRHDERVISAEMRKLELAELQGSRILKEDAREQLQEEHDIVRAGIREIPSRATKRIAALAPECVDVEKFDKIKKVLSREVESALEVLNVDRTIQTN